MNDLKNNKNYLTVSQAAVYCNVHRRTIYNWIKAGLTSEKQPTGKRFVHYIEKDILIDYINSFETI